MVQSSTDVLVSIPTITYSPGIIGPGTIDSFFLFSTDLFSDGSASGTADVALDAGDFTNRLDDMVTFASWSQTGSLLDISGTILVCSVGCVFTTPQPFDLVIGAGSTSVANLFSLSPGSTGNIGPPTPEPASLLLFGTGMLAIIRLKSKRAK